LIHRNDAPLQRPHAGSIPPLTERAMATQIKTHSIVASAINLFSDWLRRRRELRELREMNSGDFTRIARDLSISPAELDSFVRLGPHASDELPKLLEALNIDEARLSQTQPVLQRDMVRVCAACQQKARCDHELEAGTAAQHYAEYCANAPTIDGLNLEK
jgi:uncharacterized protein YjiS (DUF1127 family)